MLREEAEDLQHTEFVPDLQKIRTAGNHLLAIINDILDISKIEAGRMDLDLQTFDVLTLINEIATTLQPAAEKNENTLTVQAAANLGTMDADETKVRQILINLLGNACKFTHQGNITLIVERRSSVTDPPAQSAAHSTPDNPVNQLLLSERNAAGEWMVFRVIDTGIGMSVEQMQRLFEPFSQGDSSTTRKYGGTGLGLAISLRFCRIMGGDITVDSIVGQGSTFTMYLPVIVTEENNKQHMIDLARSTTLPSSRIVRTPLPGTVLVIDDDPATCELLGRYISREGFHVETATSGEEGLDLARSLCPDIRVYAQ
jgi:signal transduction histidine kinase